MDGMNYFYILKHVESRDEGGAALGSAVRIRKGGKNANERKFPFIHFIIHEVLSRFVLFFS